MAENKGVMVCGEIVEGKLAAITLEMLGGARALADALGEELSLALMGSGIGNLALALAIEEVCKYEAACGLILLLTALPVYPIVFAGREEQQEYYLRRVSSGEYRGCFGLTEPGAGSDAAAIVTTAIRRGD